MTALPSALQDRNLAIDALRAEAQSCRRCPLWKGTDTCVFGEGPAGARLMLVGEQPGDEEDRAGRPFVGPAGRLLDRMLGEAGLDRGEIYVTNAVKHFKYVQRGKRRLHQKPTAGEIEACRWWLDQEISLVRPRAIVMLGASAIRGVTGKAGAVGKLRGHPVEVAGAQALASYHPSFVLRLPDREAAHEAHRVMIADLRRAASAVQ